MTYREAVLRNCTEGKSLEHKLTLAGLGLTGEAGEFADLIKKIYYHEHPFDDEKRKKLLSELGDIRWYLEYAAIALDTTREEIEQINMEKCLKRYPHGFTSEDSIKRIDVNETPKE